MNSNQKGTLIRPDVIGPAVSHPTVTPLMPSAVYTSETPDMLDAQYDGDVHGYTYSREGHPNADIVAARIDRMEDAPHAGIVTSSGMAAVSAVLLGLTKSGDHVIGASTLYGRSLRLMGEDLPRMGIATTLVDPGDAAAVQAAIRPETRLILLEVVSNPTLRVADVLGIAAVARAAGVLLVIDNTFTTPRAFRAFDHGADVVIHSVTKLLAGHADVLLGYVSAKDKQINDRLRVFAVTTGMTGSPFDCWLAERGMLSFELRYDRAQATAAILADHLATLPGVTRVTYPGRSDHPDRAAAQALLKGQNCNMVSFVIDGDRATANAFARAASALSFAPTLGDVGTTISHPLSTSHRALAPDAQRALGLTEGFMRVSVGLEDATALCDVFTDAVAAARAAR